MVPSARVRAYYYIGENCSIMSNKEVVMTRAGLKALEDELEELMTVRRQEVAELIQVARGFGELSEYSE